MGYRGRGRALTSNIIVWRDELAEYVPDRGALTAEVGILGSELWRHGGQLDSCELNTGTLAGRRR